MPDTLDYMLAGYAVLWIISFAFVGSLWLRTRNLKKEVDVLQQLVQSERNAEE